MTPDLRTVYVIRHRRTDELVEFTLKKGVKKRCWHTRSAAKNAIYCRTETPYHEQHDYVVEEARLVPISEMD